MESIGRIKASHPQEVNQLQEAWEDAFAALGHKSTSEGSSGQCFGGFTTTNAIDSRPGKSERSHAGNAYLQPVLNRKNLLVETNALTTKVLLRKDKESSILTATGVEFVRNNTTYTVNATREVIVSAGL